MLRDVARRALKSAILLVGVIAMLGVGIAIREYWDTEVSESQGGHFSSYMTVDSKGRLGLWVYSRLGNCADVRDRFNNPLVFIASSPTEAATTYSVNDLLACHELRGADRRDLQVVRCANGEVTIGPSMRTTEVEGSYAINLVDGSRRVGRFRASSCEDS